MRIYGRWAGNPAGRKEDMTRCPVEVADGMLFYQCQRVKKTKEGFCTQHQKMKDEGIHLNIPEEEGNDASTND